MLLPFLLATGLVQLVLDHSLVMAGKKINSDAYAQTTADGFYPPKLTKVKKAVS